MVVAIAVAVSLLVTMGSRPPATSDLGPLDAWVGPDGHHEVTDDGVEPTVLEVTRATGGALATDLPPVEALSVPLLTAPGDGWVLEAARTGLVERLVLSRRTPAGLVTEGVVDGESALRYRPGAVLLPPRPRVGQTWVSEGTVTEDGVERPYRRVGRLEASPLGSACLQVVVEETRGGRTAAERETRCRGRGVVARGDAVGHPTEPTTSGVRVETGARPEARWPAEWAPTDRRVHSGATAVALQLPAPPVAAGPGVVMANTFSRNVSLVVRTDDEWRILWRRHPGGSPTAVSVVDRVVVVATSDRRLVAYDIAGRWLWTARTGDLANTGSVAAWPGVLATSTLDGCVVAHDLATGRELWQRDAPAGGGLAPVVAAGRVVVAAGSDVMALDRDGKVAWSFEAPSRIRELAGVGDQVVVSAQEGQLVSVGPGGETSWVTQRADPCREVHTASGLVCVDAERTTAYDPRSGQRLWQLEGTSRGSGSDGDHVLLVGDQEVRRVDAGGRVVGRWPGRRWASYDVWVTTTARGVLVGDASSGLVEWRAP